MSRTLPDKNRRSFKAKLICPTRSFVSYFFLSLLTFSVYHYWFLSRWVHDINQMCSGDGERTPGLAEMLFFNVLTFGIYQHLWFAGIADRLYNNASRYGVEILEDGTSIYLWIILLPVIGPLVAMGLMIRNTNRIAKAFCTSFTPQSGRRPRQNTAEKPLSASAPRQKPSQEKEGALLGLTGSYQGMRILLLPGQEIVLGRSPALASVVLEGAKISRIHCKIFYNGKNMGYCVTDCSQNGVFLDGKKLARDVPTHAATGSILALADRQNQFRLL